MDQKISEALESHPCYCEGAHRKYARMHLPVAPRCNIQCNFCNRKFDCCNESRPGVTSEVLSPEQAVEKVGRVLSQIPNLKVVGIAGPGDPLANEETFRTLELLESAYPDLVPCISTNGLMLPECAERLRSLNVGFVTVTVNAPDAETGARIYGSVTFEGRKHTGIEGAKILLERQKEGIRKCAELGMAVKANIVMMPGINDSSIPRLVKDVKESGACIVNILPLIPVKGTAFENMRAPTAEERRNMMDLCELDARMMRHCRQCRADAIGLLGEDRSGEFSAGERCASGCGPSNPIVGGIDERIVAVATKKDGSVGGFGNSPAFRIFATDGSTHRFLREISTDSSRPVSGTSHREHVAEIIRSLDGCGTIVVSEIGEMPSGMLASAGIKTAVFRGSVADALRELRRDSSPAAENLRGRRTPPISFY